MPKSSTRRDFLNTAGAAGAVLSSGVWSDAPARASSAPIEKLNIAMIGAGGRMPDPNVIAETHHFGR
jgi:hypothetical protein